MYSDGRMEVRDLVTILIRRRKIIALTIGGCVAIAAAGNLLLPTWYESNVNLRVKYNRSINDGIGTLSQEEVMRQQIYTYAEILKGKTVVETAVAKAFGELAEEARPDYETVSKRIEAVPLKNTEILTVAVQGKTPEEAQTLANALVDTLLLRLTDIVRAEGRETKTFIGHRLEEAKGNLEKIEKEIIAYKEGHQAFSVNDQTKNLLERQVALKKVMVENQMALSNGTAKLASINRQIAQENPGFIGDSPLIQQYKSKLEELDIELIGLRKSYKENHPKVQSLQASINGLKEKLDTEIHKVAESESPSSNPVHLGLVQGKLQAEVDAAGARAQRAALSQEAGMIAQELVNQPNKEQGLAKLLRDSAVAEQSYLDLAKSYDQARIDEVKEPTNVQIVDLPDRPVKAAKPRQLLNLAIGLLVGLFAGIIAAFAAEAFYKTIDTPAEAAKYLDLPVLGGIPAPLSRQEESFWAKFCRRFTRSTARRSYNG